jgi:hypothetical protein
LAFIRATHTLLYVLQTTLFFTMERVQSTLPLQRARIDMLSYNLDYKFREPYAEMCESVDAIVGATEKDQEDLKDAISDDAIWRVQSGALYYKVSFRLYCENMLHGIILTQCNHSLTHAI